MVAGGKRRRRAATGFDGQHSAPRQGRKTCGPSGADQERSTVSGGGAASRLATGYPLAAPPAHQIAGCPPIHHRRVSCGIRQLRTTLLTAASPVLHLRGTSPSPLPSAGPALARGVSFRLWL